MSQETLMESPQEGRAQIERTRARMSETIDEIEGALLRKKEEIQDRLDLGAPIRERPLPSLGIALGAGLVVGFLTAGDERDERSHRELAERADTWEARARRLMRIAEEQQVALRRAGAANGGGGDIAWRPDPRLMGDGGAPHRDGSSRIDEVWDMATNRVSDYLGDTIRQLFGHRA